MKDCRPTTGRVLQALFNILGPIGGVPFLDLFSGTGRVAEEAARRGAEPVVAVESDRGRGEAIRSRLEGRGVRVLIQDVRRALPLLVRRGERFGLIFADPPYDLGWGDLLPGLLGEGHLLAPGGRIVLERSIREEVRLGSLWEREDRRYGDTILSFLRLRDPVGAEDARERKEEEQS
jgi:16S rRNA (guanine(966)-N(2))-methyltransferase RsmD